ncbi:MAG: glycosyltransferase family 4 protein [Planctomycetota bacterium]
MRIAVVSHDSFWPLKGGGGIRVFWVAKKMLRKNHNITVIAPFLTTKGLDTEFKEIEICNLGRVTRFVKFKEIVYVLLMLKIFFKLLFMSKEFDLIYAHNVVAGFPSLLFAKLKNIPHIFDMDDILTGHSPNRFVRYCGQVIDYFTAKHSDLTVVMSKSLENKLRSKKIQHVECVPHGVDLSIFKPQDRKREFIVYAGGIEKDDGVLLVPEAAEIILKRYPNEKFLFIGEGRGLAGLKDMVKERQLSDSFVFRGWVDHKEIPYYLSGSKIGLVTNIKTAATEIAASLRVLEYMAAGLPVVIPDLDGMIEQVGSNGVGVIFKNGDAEDLAEKILLLLEDEDASDDKGRQGRDRVLNNYDWEVNAGKIVELCEHCRSR